VEGNQLSDKVIRELSAMKRKLASMPVTPLAPQLRMKTREVPGGLRSGEFIYMEPVVVAQNTYGWRMDRACPLIPNA
jgi:hypothetical protein